MLGAWIIVGDPFGISTASDRAIANEIRAITAILQPASQPPVTVVAIDADSIEKLHKSGWMTANDWPLTYADHKRILSDLVDTAPQADAPSAVFYDIFFEKERITSGDMSHLGRRLNKLEQREDNPPIFFAGGGFSMEMSREAYSALAEPRLTTTDWNGYGDDYPLQEQLWEEDTTQSVIPGKAPTPAVALYRQWCQAAGGQCEPIELDHAAPLSPKWNLTAADHCAPQDFGTRIWRVLSRTVSGLFNGAFGLAEPRTAPASCLPYRTVRLSELYSDSPTSLRPPEIAPEAPFVVLAGVVMPSLDDYVHAPIYGQVEGIYLHAAATANLIKNGSDYLQPADLTLWALSGWAVAVVIFMAVAARKGPARPLFQVPLVRFLFTATLTIVVVMAIYWVCYYWARIEPFGWLSLIAIIPPLREVVARGEAQIHAKVQGNQGK